MIISHKYKFIFLKTSKTAGTSVEIALSKFCGADDIITSIALKDEKIRNALGYPGPQNHLQMLPLYKYNSRNFLSLGREGRPARKFYHHMTAKEVEARVEGDVWNGYYKFCIERNPWDRVVSQYYFRNKSEPRPSIAQFVASRVPLNLKKLGFRLYTIDGQIAVDKICRFENLSEDLEVVRKQLGIPEKLELPNAKGDFRKDKRSYREILGENERERILELFQDEIKLFGYEF